MPDRRPLRVRGAYAESDAEAVPVALTLADGAVDVAPEAGHAVRIALDEVSRVEAGDYDVALTLPQDRRVVFSKLGARHDEFAEEVLRERNVATSRAVLCSEECVPAEFEGAFDSDGSPVPCHIAFYATRLVVSPEEAFPEPIEYADIASASFDAAEHDVAIVVRDGSVRRLGKLGGRTDEAAQELRGRLEAFGRLFLTAIDLAFVPDGDATRRVVEALLFDGHSAPVASLRQANVDPWAVLRASGDSMETERAEYAKALVELCGEESVRIGVKLLADPRATDTLTVSLPDESAPIRELQMIAWATAGLPRAAGGAVAFVEVLTEADCATYAFRVGEGSCVGDAEDLERCLRRIQFRRDPVRAPQDQPGDPLWVKYAPAIRHVPELRLLREAFAGRVAHTSVEAWRKALEGYAG